jgi:DNA-binding phage protein
MAAYPDACFEEPDLSRYLRCQSARCIARAQGISNVANSMGPSGTSQLKVLYEETDLSLEIIFRIISALGLKLCAGVKEDMEVI